MTKTKLFFGSLFFTAGLLSVLFFFNRPKRYERVEPELVRLANDVYLGAQLRPENIAPLRERGIKTIIDMRPNGEEKDQPSSFSMSRMARRNGMDFRYTPVPHETIPEEAVLALEAWLTTEAKPAVLYCRTGRRAARLFALVEASRDDGPDLNAILETVRAAKFTADDLKEDIAKRISQRKSQPAERKN
jgi:uncharacterized protein (TIGR01244 family)